MKHVHDSAEEQRNASGDDANLPQADDIAAFGDNGNESDLPAVKIDTVDGLKGESCPLVLLGRAVADKLRFGITRVDQALVLIGDESTL